MAGVAINETIRERRAAILRVAAAHGATQVRLIGSVARGEARPDSDIDLLVTWQQGTSLLDQAALKLELENLLGRKVRYSQRRLGETLDTGIGVPGRDRSMRSDQDRLSDILAAIAKIKERVADSLASKGGAPGP